MSWLQFALRYSPHNHSLAKDVFSPVCVTCWEETLYREDHSQSGAKHLGWGSKTGHCIRSPQTTDPRRLTWLSHTERGSPQPREPRKSTRSWHRTSQSSPSNMHFAALDGTGRPGVHRSQGKALDPAPLGWGKRWHLEPALLGAALSTQLLPQEAGPEAGGDPTGQFPYPRPAERAVAQCQSSYHVFTKLKRSLAADRRKTHALHQPGFQPCLAGSRGDAQHGSGYTALLKTRD